MISFQKFFLVACIVFFLPLCGWAELTYKARWDFSVTGFSTEINQEGFSEFDHVNEYLGLAGLQQIVQWQPWIFEIRPELRYLYSPAYDVNEFDTSLPSLDNQDRRMDWGKSLRESDTDEIFFDLETLYLKYQSDQFEALAGRQYLSLGIIKNFPIWNKFSSFNLINTRMPLQHGADQLSGRFQGDNWWLQEVAVFGSREEPGERDAYLTIAGFPLEILEFQLLYAYWWEEQVLGFNAQKDFEGVLVKTEWLFIGLGPYDEDRHAQGAMALEYAFNQAWSTTLEAIYFSDGSDIVYDLPLDPPSIYFPLRSSGYLLWQLDWQATPFWLISATPVMNLIDQSTLFSLMIRKNLSDNADITFQFKTPLGESETEFSPSTFIFTDGSRIGFNQTASLQFKIFF